MLGKIERAQRIRGKIVSQTFGLYSAFLARIAIILRFVSCPNEKVAVKFWILIGIPVRFVRSATGSGKAVADEEEDELEGSKGCEDRGKNGEEMLNWCVDDGLDAG